MGADIVPTTSSISPFILAFDSIVDSEIKVDLFAQVFNQMNITDWKTRISDAANASLIRDESKVTAMNWINRNFNDGESGKVEIM